MITYCLRAISFDTKYLLYVKMALRWDIIANVACPCVDDSGLVGKVRLIF